MTVRTLVVDDDYRVARLHAELLSRIDGFECVGEAHTAAEAREMIAALEPDLLLLDVYLPDEDGLSLLRTLVAAGRPIDAVVITAARELSSVREAMSAGAVHYLVKPFGLGQLREQLTAYRQWRRETSRTTAVDQDTVDALFSLRHGGVKDRRRRLPETMTRVLAAVRESTTGPVGANEVADLLGVSRATAQRYLSDLERRGLITIDLVYGTMGRPQNRYR